MTEQKPSNISDRIKNQREKLEFLAFMKAAAITIAAASVLLIFFTNDVSDWSRQFREDWVPIWRFFAAVVLLVVTGYFAFLYMVGDLFPGRKAADIDEGGNGISSLLELAEVADKIENAVNKISENRVLSESDFNAISDRISEQVESKFPESVFTKIETRYGNSALGAAVLEDIGKIDKEISRTLSKAQEDAKRKSSSSLAFGLSIGVFGVLFLGYFAAFPDKDLFKDTDRIFQITYYITKIGFVAVVETIAIFFFRQYRASLSEEIKIVNLATDYKVKIGALMAACRLGDPETTKLAFRGLAVGASGSGIGSQGDEFVRSKIEQLSSISGHLAKTASSLKSATK